MKQNMPSYVANIAKSDIDVIDELFEKFYNEFYTFYFAVKEHTDYIKAIKFKKKQQYFRVEIIIDDDLDRFKFSQLIRDNAPESIKIKTKPDCVVVLIHKN